MIRKLTYAEVNSLAQKHNINVSDLKVIEYRGYICHSGKITFRRKTKSVSIGKDVYIKDNSENLCEEDQIRYSLIMYVLNGVYVNRFGKQEYRKVSRLLIDLKKFEIPESKRSSEVYNKQLIMDILMHPDESYNDFVVRRLMEGY